MNDRTTCRVTDCPRLSSSPPGPCHGRRKGTLARPFSKLSASPTTVRAVTGMDAVWTSGRSAITMTPILRPAGDRGRSRPRPQFIEHADNLLILDGSDGVLIDVITPIPPADDFVDEFAAAEAE